jgi:DNA mismatch repair protein MutS
MTMNTLTQTLNQALGASPMSDQDAALSPMMREYLRAKDGKLTPMMEQYFQARRSQPTALIFFRMGDFYELFFEDAQTAHRLLNLTLTSRDKDEPKVPMVGVPVRSLDDYLSDLAQRGFRVAICEQLESASKDNPIVRRGISRVVSPGTLLDGSHTNPDDAHSNRFLAAISTSTHRNALRDEVGIALLDLNTGSFSATEVFGLPALAAELTRANVREALIIDRDEPTLRGLLQRMPSTCIQALPADAFDPRKVAKRLSEQPRDVGSLTDKTAFLPAARLEGFFQQVRGASFKAAPLVEGACAALLFYVADMLRGVASHIEHLQLYRTEEFMTLDEATQANLELTETMRGSKREGSLLAVLDKTITAAGARRRRPRVTYPLIQPRKIEARLDAVQELVDRYALRQTLRQWLDKTDDIERLCARVATDRATPRDLIALRNTLDAIPELRQHLSPCQSRMLHQLAEALDPCAPLATLIRDAITDEPPASLSDGGTIRPSFDVELAKLLTISHDAKDWLMRYEADQRVLTGIATLKIKYAKNFGYYIEVSKAKLDKVPAHFRRSQTLTNAERFLTPELQEYQEKVLTAEDDILRIEQEVFARVRAAALDAISSLRQNAQMLASLDVLASLAELAHAHHYCRPSIHDDDRLRIVDGRHPVVESFIGRNDFITNDIALNSVDARLHIITGPNMAGKSTVIRQVALITLMAQIGSFVPAASAEIGLVDRIFSRVGASDNLALGQSTFMVEMTETAHILEHATARSLIILDEVGRGTSTFDGLSIAWAIAEHLHDHTRARTLFATHYHELTKLADLRPSIVNAHISVSESNEDIIFLRKLLPGPASRSYGIQVARLAGLPAPVLDRARALLLDLERKDIGPASPHPDGAAPTQAAPHQPPVAPPPVAPPPVAPPPVAPPPEPQQQLHLFSPAAPPPPVPNQQVIDALLQLQLDATTPIQALNALYRWQRHLKRTSAS